MNFILHGKTTQGFAIVTHGLATSYGIEYRPATYGEADAETGERELHEPALFTTSIISTTAAGGVIWSEVPSRWEIGDVGTLDDLIKHYVKKFKKEIKRLQNENPGVEFSHATSL